MSGHDPSNISDSRKTVYYGGMVISGIGLLVFLSNFLVIFSDNGPGFGDAKGFAARIVVGMVMLMAGGAISRAGARGLAGSGIILDPKRARSEVEPWTRMAGGMMNDALDEVDAVKQLGQSQAPAEALVKIRCRSCQSLNEEHSKFCNQCGAQL
jgi:hypothetical protein